MYKPHKIIAVRPDSPAFRAGIKPGDLLLTINGRAFTDIIDYRFLLSDGDPSICIRLLNGGFKKIVLSLSPGEDPGLEFASITIDNVKVCQNRCSFCFVDQMPPGLRPTLKFKDDDYRLSLLYGNYITLTNLKRDELARIVSCRLSPLYVSIHATDGKVRRDLLNNQQADKIMEQLRYLVSGGITIHGQFVLCPGINDGDILRHSLEDLAPLYPGVASLAVVPVGLTRYRRGRPSLSGFDQQTAVEVKNLVEKYQHLFLKQMRTRFVFLSDEFYLMAGDNIPQENEYEGFPQLEDGVGICRLFLKELDEWRRNIPIPKKKNRLTIVTGVSGSRFLQQVVDLLNRQSTIDARLAVIENKFFGSKITVAGLLTGQDLKFGLPDAREDELLILPGIMFNEDNLTLDGMSIEKLKETVGYRQLLPCYRLNDISAAFGL